MVNGVLCVRMRNALYKKRMLNTPGDAFLSVAMVAIPLGIASALALAAVRLMPQLTLWDLVLGFIPLAGFAAFEILTGMIPMLFLYFLFCRAADWVEKKGVPAWVGKSAMMAGAGLVSAVAVDYCSGLWQQYAAVETRCAATAASMLLLLPAWRGYCLFRNRTVIKSVYLGTLVFCLVLGVQALLWGGWKGYWRGGNTFSHGASAVSIPLLPEGNKDLILHRNVSYTPDRDAETFSEAVGKPLPLGSRVIRTGYYNTGAILSVEMTPELFREYGAGLVWQEAEHGICFRVGDGMEVLSPRDFNAMIPLLRSIWGGEQQFLLQDDSQHRLLLLLLR